MEKKIKTDNEEVKDIDLGDEQKIDRAIVPPPRRYQRRRQGQYVPDYVDWKDLDF